MNARSGLHILLAAAALMLLNVGKPLVVDDDAYFQFARHIAEDPSDPYGFELFVGDRYAPAHRILAPPVLPHWWAVAIALFGENVVAWKLWLFPFALILAWAISVLAGRFAQGLEGPLVWLGVLSPAVAPAFNLMLDVPALALMLAALAVFVKANAADSLGLAAWAGVIAGVALQTKYTAVTGVAAVVVYAALHRRFALGLVAGGVATLVFVGWEASMAWHYGESHFLLALSQRSAQAPDDGPARWAVGFLTILGASGPALGLLALAGAGGRTKLVGAGAALALAVFGVLLMLPPQLQARYEILPNLALPRFELWLLGCLGLGVLAAGAAAFRQLARDADGRFLLVWLGIELVGFFVMSPFLALRRVLGLGAAWLLAAGSAAGRSGAPPRLVNGVAVFGCVFGVAFGLADLGDARARRALFEEAVALLEARGVDPHRERVWFLGMWSVKFLAEREGMRPVIPGSSRLQPGDWLLVPTGVPRQRATFPGETRGDRETISVRGPLPWSTLPNSYAGAIPIQRQPEIQMQIKLQQLLRELVPPRLEPDR